MSSDQLQFTLFYVLVLTVNIVVSSLLHTFSFPESFRSLQMGVMYSSMSFMFLILYYFVFEGLRCCLPRSWGLGRRISGDYYSGSSSYSDLDTRRGAEILQGRPRLLIGDVWSIVYGLGFSYFTLNYVLICHSSSAVISCACGFVFLVTHEIVTGGWLIFTKHNLIYYLSAFLSLIGVLMHSAQWEFRDIYDMVMVKREPFEIGFGLILPFVNTVLMMTIGSSRKYSLGGVYELSEFGMPFACILSMLLFSCMYNLQGPDEQELWTFMSRKMFLTLLVSPISLFGIILLVVHAVVRKHCVDVLISMCVAWGVVNLVQDHQGHRKGGEFDAGTLGLGFAALVVRLVLTTRLVENPNDVEGYPMNSVVIPNEVVMGGMGQTGKRERSLKEFEDALEDDLDDAASRGLTN